MRQLKVHQLFAGEAAALWRAEEASQIQMIKYIYMYVCWQIDI